ncbi:MULTISPECIES: hypothetical protein [unclassified Arenibacter]|uniref:hypothetical protein n=1 Tax=unclassified Arenibacter TaxID=2615047 RepID=UPI000E34C406|nr:MULTISPECIES: hypothetical protein [unclassified Arenibacter]MCM4165989.1 hypothetical protein [Arenibacter sp. A80]RFT54376.1 hypothetical protein D0S24_20505 [Arenibacter sp. P308M17]
MIKYLLNNFLFLVFMHSHSLKPNGLDPLNISALKIELDMKKFIDRISLYNNRWAAFKSPGVKKFPGHVNSVPDMSGGGMSIYGAISRNSR